MRSGERRAERAVSSRRSLTAVTVLVSPASGSVSLVSTLPVAGEPPEPLAIPPFSVASPVSATAVGGVFGAERVEDDIDPVVGGAEGAGREDAGGDGSAIGIDAIAAGRGGGGCRQRTAGEGGGEEVVGRHIGAGRVIRGDIGRVGGDRDGRGKAHGLPAARGGVRECRAGELGSGRGPQVEDVRAGVAGAAVEFERGDLAGNGGLELHADFELASRHSDWFAPVCWTR